MYLKKIVISGFKSFADRSTLTLKKSDITGIIGPNGSGKSNVIDAVRWVMGEQNAKMLRGERATDIIFSGSEKRNAQSMAEVSLVFDNSENSPFCPIEFRHEPEITISRRLYADASREYAINKRPCRFKDITNFFISSSLGSRSYSMIQQGQVDRILQARPEQIREIIEEAAGTVVFKKRAQETDKKLEATRGNLSRIDDISKEVETQISSLEEQVKRSKEWQTLNEKLKHSELDLWFLRKSELQEKHGTLSKRISEESAQGVRNLADLTRFESDLTKLTEEIEASDPAIKQLNEDISNIRESLARSEESLKNSLKLISGGDEDIRSRMEEVKKLETKGLELSEQKSKLDEQYKETKETFDEMQASLDEERYQMEMFQERETVLRNKLQNLKDELRSIEKLLHTNSGRMELIKKNLQNANREKDEYIKKLIQLEDKHSQDLILIDGARIKVDKQKRELDKILEEKSKIESEFSKETEALEVVKHKVDALREEQLNSKAEIRTLEELKNSLPGSHKVLDALKKDGARYNFTILNESITFSDKIESLSPLTISALELWTDRLVFSSQKDFNAFTTCIPDLPLGKLQASLLGDNNSNDIRAWAEANGGIPLTNYLHFDNELTDVRTILDTLIYIPQSNIDDSIYEAIDLGATIFLEDGVIVSDRRQLSIGSESKSGRLTQQTKEKEKRETLGQIESKLEATRVEQGNIEENIQNLKQKLDEVQAQSLEHNKVLLSTSAELQALESQLEHKEEMIISAREQAKQIEDNCERLETEFSDLTHTNESLQKEKKESNSEATTLREDIDELRYEKDIFQESCHQKKIDLASFSEKLQAIEAQVFQMDSRIPEHEKEYKEKKRLLEERKKKIQLARDNREAFETEISELLRLREEKEHVLSEKQKSSHITREQLKELENKLKICRSLESKFNKSVSESEIELEKTKLSLDALFDQTKEKYKLSLDSWEIKGSGTTASLARTIKSTKEKLETFGPINMMASKEYEELVDRKSFIDEQKNEVLSSMEILEQAKNEIEDSSRSKFMKTFTSLNQEFQGLFPILFPGGESKLELTDPENPLQGGVEILVRLPGKKQQHMRLFSGGEKALTAISLIFALLKSNPTPFCFLDEVDAPLDEANIKKFNRVIETLSKRFQFIVITHSRRTMEVFDTLYGVTMQEPGVSKLVGVNLGEALPSHLQKSFSESKTERPQTIN